jgi:hypothetical protein
LQRNWGFPVNLIPRGKHDSEQLRPGQLGFLLKFLLYIGVVDAQGRRTRAATLARRPFSLEDIGVRDANQHTSHQWD